MKNFLTLFLLLSFAFSQAVGSQSGPKQAVGGEKPTSKPAFGAKNRAANGAKQDAAAKNGVRQCRSAKDASPLTGSKFSDYSGLKFVPRPSLKGKQTGELELRFSYDVEKTGERDPDTSIELNDVYERIYTPQGQTLFYEKKIGYTKPPLRPLLKQVVKFIKSGPERWITVDYYDADGSLGVTAQHCLRDEINAEAKEAFDKGEVAALYTGSNKFDVMMNIFSDNNTLSYANGKPSQKHYITVREGVKEDYYENFTPDGKIADTSYLKDTEFIWLKRFYPSGALKTLSHYKNGFERQYDERGRLVKEERLKIRGK